MKKPVSRLHMSDIDCLKILYVEDIQVFFQILLLLMEKRNRRLRKS